VQEIKANLDTGAHQEPKETEVACLVLVHLVTRETSVLPGEPESPDVTVCYLAS